MPHSSSDEVAPELQHRVRLQQEAGWQASRGSDPDEVTPSLVAEIAAVQKRQRSHRTLYLICGGIVLLLALILIPYGLSRRPATGGPQPGPAPGLKAPPAP